MNRIAVMREAIVRITKILSEKDIKVTNRGVSAYVEYDRNSGCPILVNLPYIPDDASEALLRAIQGFLDHEVAHIFFTDYSALKEAKNLGVHSIWNSIEDCYIERKMAERFAGSGLKRPLLRVQHTLNTEESHIVGQWTAKGGETKFELGPLALAMKHGWVYLADEYDFALPSVLSVYQPVLEGKSLVVKEADAENRIIRPHENFRFVATGNTNGSGDETGLYQGTSIQNAANYDRFEVVLQARYMAHELEARILTNQAKIPESDAKRIVEFASRVREGFEGADKYNPDHGVTFSAYLGRAIWNQFNKFAEKEIRVQADLKLVRFEQLGDAVEDSDDGSVYESIASDEWTPEQYVEAAQQFRENMKSLGPTAKFIVSKLLNPTNDLMEALELAKRNAELARKSGQYAKAPNDVTIAFIASHYGLDEKNVKKARKTLFSMYGLTKGTRG